MAADPLTKTTIDDLLEYNFGDDDDNDPFADSRAPAKRDDKATLSPRGKKRSAFDDDKENLNGLGLDQEVTIKKRKIPNPKLDDQRLLSEPGIPKIRALARSGKIGKKLHFKGKGHEFSDVARLLSYYQLWLDDLFPRAKFADGLVMVEKVGHSKRMQIMRKEWINEGKPGYARELTLDGVEARKLSIENAEELKKFATEDEQADDGNMFFPDANKEKGPANDDLPEDDELDALMAEQAASAERHIPPRDSVDSEGEDDLDAVLAAQDTRSNGNLSRPVSNSAEDMDETDDLDALLAEQESRIVAAAQPETQSKRSKPRNSIFDDDDGDLGEDDLDALLAEQGTREELERLPVPIPGTPLSQKTPSTTQIPQSKSAPQGLRVEEEVVEADLLSSPLPNNPEEEDLADFLSSPIMN